MNNKTKRKVVKWAMRSTLRMNAAIWSIRRLPYKFSSVIRQRKIAEESDAFLTLSKAIYIKKQIVFYSFDRLFGKVTNLATGLQSRARFVIFPYCQNYQSSPLFNSHFYFCVWTFMDCICHEGWPYSFCVIKRTGYMHRDVSRGSLEILGFLGFLRCIVI